MSVPVYNPESILDSIKKLLGIDFSYTQFDPDIIIHINMAFGFLSQMGVGPSEAFSISSNETVWSDFFGESGLGIKETVKTYIYLKVRMVFDPPSSGIVAESFNKAISELEWRLHVENDKEEEVT